MTPAGIEPATFWFVAQHLNHCATAVPDAPVYQIYFILEWHYMFRTVFPSIIRSSRLYIQQQAFVKLILLYVQPWTPDDGQKERPKHVEYHSKIK